MQISFLFVKNRNIIFSFLLTTRELQQTYIALSDRIYTATLRRISCVFLPVLLGRDNCIYLDYSAVGNDNPLEAFITAIIELCSRCVIMSLHVVSHMLGDMLPANI